MSKFKLNSEVENSENRKKQHAVKKHRDRDHEDFTYFAYMSRGAAKEELRYLKETYGI